MTKRALFILLALMLQTCIAQQLIEKSKIVLQLKNGIELNCYKAFSFDKDVENFYYVPVNMHFTHTSSGKKAYSVVVYKDANNQIKGGIMHWLLTWGINQKLIDEARTQLKLQKGENAQLLGAVLPEMTNSPNAFEITGNNDLANLLQMTIVSQSKVPLVSNTNMAIAFRFSKDEASIIKDLLENYLEQKNTFVVMRFVLNFKKSSGRIYKREFQLNQNLRNLFY